MCWELNCCGRLSIHAARPCSGCEQEGVPSSGSGSFASSCCQCSEPIETARLNISAFPCVIWIEGSVSCKWLRAGNRRGRRSTRNRRPELAISHPVSPGIRQHWCCGPFGPASRVPCPGYVGRQCAECCGQSLDSVLCQWSEAGEGAATVPPRSTEAAPVRHLQTQMRPITASAWM